MYKELTINNIKEALNRHAVENYKSFNFNTIFKKIERCILLNNPNGVKKYFMINNVEIYERLKQKRPPVCL